MSLKAYLPEREFLDTFANYSEVVVASRELSDALQSCQHSQRYYVQEIAQVLIKEVR